MNPDLPGFFGEGWEEEFERDRGLFTGTDRKFLTGVTSYEDSPEARSRRRKSIRDRTVNGLFDLYYLSMIEPRQRDAIFEEFTDHKDPNDLRDSVSTLIQFLYVGLDGEREWLEQTLIDGIDRAEQELRADRETYRTGTGITVDIEVNRAYDVDEIEERFRSGRGNTLTPTEVGVLIRSGRIAPDELAALDNTVRDRLNPETGELEDPGPNPVFEGPEPQAQEDEEDTE